MGIRNSHVRMGSVCADVNTCTEGRIEMVWVRLQMSFLVLTRMLDGIGIGNQ